ncbi:hypothetical protein [Bacteroides sp.]|uniref:hypothetical protein n=1 Tax=Bacteroides sp. TaxID=29523 RepID=UPI00260D6FB1|nr:hypothetical protein [Bacteroides sp.]MDD3039308.1 hypothetical protein [Bacteroides sp.]
MFVCGGSFFVKAQITSEKAVTAPTEVKTIVVVNDTVVTDTVVKDSTTVESAKE